MAEIAGREVLGEREAVLVPVEVEGQTVYLAVQDRGYGSGVSGRESDIAARRPSLDEALDGLMGLARAMGTRLQQTDATKVTIEFGCEFVLESGSFVAVVGKASAKSSFLVGLEWDRPAG
ncbi:CU044_2847 family protein [Streptomyces flaveus]|uniref:CU044_2847 family protein n=1 Tax=Streptomyces flaveus TaxID=66370 RepID=UPI00331F6412